MGCGTRAGGTDLAGVDLDRQAVIQGVVTRDDAPVAGAYVRLLDRTGEFVAEEPTDVDGAFRFFAADGDWTVRTLAPRTEPVERRVRAQIGSIIEVRIAI